MTRYSRRQDLMTFGVSMAVTLLFGAASFGAALALARRAGGRAAA